MEIKNKKDILHLLGNAENVEVEFKSAKGGLPESFWETFSAFANTNGGVIVLGVKEKDGKVVPDGLTDEQIVTYKKRFWDCAHNKEKVSATMLIERDVTEMEVGNGKVLIFHIPRASYDLRPVYLTKNPFGNTYKRNHEGDYHCTDAEVRQMFSDAHHTTLPFDNQILPNYTINDIDIPSLKGYRQRFSLKKENHPWNELDDMAFMVKLGVYRVDRETGEEGFTRAGILMFGKTESITDQACTPWYFVDYQEKMSNDPHQRWTDRIYPDGTWNANLYQFFFRVYNKLTQTLPVPFLLDGVTRQEETTAHVAIREALVNTLVHCNYAVQGNIVVTRDMEQITFRNPGCMLISVEDFYAGSQSLCRNPILQKFFIQLGVGEKAGSGADYIVKGWQDNRWDRPHLAEKVQPDVVTLTLQLKEVGSNSLSQVCPKSVLSLSQVCPQFVLSLSQACPKLEQKYVESAKNILAELLSVEEISVPALMAKVKEKNRSRFKRNIIDPLIDAELVEPTIKDKPTSSKQTYRLTDKARKLMKA
ncbi:MAG: putative DNA binding domain-containing protein [Bacteroidaceae bacterium]|nr:putative DNA binding domain-containing protein [Bacteroidaceae bacterium]